MLSTAIFQKCVWAGWAWFGIGDKIKLNSGVATLCS